MLWNYKNWICSWSNENVPLKYFWNTNFYLEMAYSFHFPVFHILCPYMTSSWLKNWKLNLSKKSLKLAHLMCRANVFWSIFSILRPYMAPVLPKKAKNFLNLWKSLNFTHLMCRTNVFEEFLTSCALIWPPFYQKSKEFPASLENFELYTFNVSS